MMDVRYRSTRNSEVTVTASQAILKGLADDGGLFVRIIFQSYSVYGRIKGNDISGDSLCCNEGIPYRFY